MLQQVRRGWLALALGVVVGAVIAIPFGILRAPEASAHTGCEYHLGSNIIGRDKGPDRVGQVNGNAGDVWVNDLDGTEHAVIRVMIAANDVDYNNIEWGWYIGPDTGQSSHTSFVAHEINGSYYCCRNLGILTKATWYRFKLEDGNKDTVWRFLRDGSEAPYTVDHNFSQGGAFAMTERESGCDTGFGSFKNLANCTAEGCSTYRDWQDLVCRYDDMPGYKFHKVSTTWFQTIDGDAAC